MKHIEKISDRALELTHSVKVSTAIKPGLWAIAITTPPSFLFVLIHGSIPYLIYATVIIPVVVFAISYLYLLVFDADRLHTEEYHLQNKALERIYEKGSEIEELPGAEPVNSNPRLKTMSKLNDQSSEKQNV